MAIYIATDDPLPTIPYDESNPKLNTENPAGNEMELRNVFSKPHIKYVGSNQGCGCGFRHALLDNENWLKVLNEEETGFDNNNHLDLVDLISKNSSSANSVEILSVWEGDHREAIKYRQTINLTEILDSDFYFKERGLYTVVV